MRPLAYADHSGVFVETRFKADIRSCIDRKYEKRDTYGRFLSFHVLIISGYRFDGRYYENTSLRPEKTKQLKEEW